MEHSGKYHWEEWNGYKYLIIEVGGRRWRWGSVMLRALEKMMEIYPDMTLQEAVEKERFHWGGWEMSSLHEEIEVLKQTPEYKALEEKYGGRR